MLVGCWKACEDRSLYQLGYFCRWIYSCQDSHRRMEWGTWTLQWSEPQLHPGSSHLRRHWTWLILSIVFVFLGYTLVISIIFYYCKLTVFDWVWPSFPRWLWCLILLSFAFFSFFCLENSSKYLLLLLCFFYLCWARTFSIAQAIFDFEFFF